jgi:hypothetical protein
MNVPFHISISVKGESISKPAKPTPSTYSEDTLDPVQIPFRDKQNTHTVLLSELLNILHKHKALGCRNRSGNKVYFVLSNLMINKAQIFWKDITNQNTFHE